MLYSTVLVLVHVRPDLPGLVGLRSLPHGIGTTTYNTSGHST